MAVRDDVRQLATKKAQAAALPPGFSSAPPTNPSAVIAAPVPSKPANKGVKRFFVGPGGDWGDLASPAWWGRELGKVGKETFVDPARRAARAVDPTSNASPLERAAGISEGALLALDVATPLLPEGAIANSLRREAMERALDREVAGYAASGGGARYRGVLGVHGSPVSGLSQIEPQIGSVGNPKESVAWFWDAATGGYDPADLMNRARAYAGEPGQGGQIYVARFPRRSVVDPSEMRPNPVTYPNQSYAPGRVVGSVNVKPEMFEDIGQPSPIITLLRPDAYSTLADDLREQMVRVMTPAERRTMARAAQLPTAVSASNLAHEARLLRARYEELARRTGDF